MLALIVSSVLLWWLGALLLLAVIITGVAAWIVLRSKSEEAPVSIAAPAGEQSASGGVGAALSRYLPVTSLRLSFREAVRFLSGRMAGLDYRYDVPWYMVLGEDGSGHTTMLDSAAGDSRYSSEDDFGIPTGVRWRFFDEGVLLDVPGQFIVHGDGSAGDSRSWQALLGLLLQHRARRPIDGIVVTVPASELIGPAADPERARRKAAQISEVLWSAQRVLGVRFPVYVIVTKCDLVEGFTSFVQELTPTQSESIFGWSGSYNIDAVFTPRWVDEAFQYLYEQLNRIEGELFAQVGDLRDPDGVFLFPSEFQKLRLPLRNYLEQLFRPAAYRDSCPVRGIYFCGAKTSPEEAAEAVGSDTGIVRSGKVAFAADLFRKKIFPECGLAHPYLPAFVSRNRTVLTCQIVSAALAVILITGMALGYFRLLRTNDEVAPVLARVSADIREESNDARQGKGDSTARLHRTSDLIDGMRTDRSSELHSWFYPTSLVSPIPRRIQTSMVTGYQSLVLGPLRRAIRERVVTLSTSGAPNLDTSAAPSADVAAVAAPASLQETPDFHALQSFDGELGRIQEAIARYNDLCQPGRGTPEDLRFVVTFLYGGSAPNLDLSTPDFSNALQHARGATFEMSLADKERLQNTFAILTKNLFGTIATNDFILRDVKDLQQKIGDLPKAAYADLQSLRNSIAATESLLGRPDVSWVAGRRTEVRDDVRDLTETPIDTWTFLQPAERSALRETVRQQRATALESLRADLTARQTDLTGPVVEWDDSNLRLSPDVETLRLALENVLALGFMSIASDQTFTTEIPTGTRPQWSSAPLQDAGNMFSAWERFENEALINCPSAMRDALDLLSRDKLGRAMRVLIAQGQSFVPLATSDVSGDDALLEHADNFRSVVPLLTQLIRDFDRLELAKSRTQLLHIGTGEATSILESLDRRLSEDGPYGMRDDKLGWWDGTRPVSTALGAANPVELAAYLGTQRAQLQRLVGAADGPVTFLNSSASSRKLPMVVKWHGIIDELHRYNDKVAGNSVSILEDYVLNKLDGIKPEDGCAMGVQKAAATPNDDYFTQARLSFQLTVYRRCRVLAERVAYRNYSEIAEQFNTALSGKFPFAVFGDGESTDADLDALRAFYRLYAQMGDSTREILRTSSHFGRSRQDAVRFLEQISEVRRLLAPFIDGAVVSPAFDVLPEFRTNRDRESGANQIIEWSMLIGTGRVSSDDLKPVAKTWKFGDPVQVVLRWAKDSSYAPVIAARNPALTVKDRTVEVNYRGGWSLLRLIYGSRALPTEFSGLNDPNPYTLLFQVPTSPAIANAGDAPAPRDARAFISIHLSAPGQTVLQTLPTFPTKAPQLDKDPTIED